MKQYKVCLSIAGSDPSGGAGIQADLKTFSALGCYGCAAITALTAQNTEGVEAVSPVSSLLVEQQIAAVLQDIVPQSVKTGMTGNSEIIRTIARVLRRYAIPYLVVDPVLISSSGTPLTDEDAVETFKKELLPLATLVTPNLPELKALTGISDPLTAARQLLEQGTCRAVLVKGGHRNGEPTDILVMEDMVKEYRSPRIKTHNDHGTGCTLSSAIAAYLAQGTELTEAVRKAKRYVSEALYHGAEVAIGKGHGPMNHFFNPQPYIIEEK